MKKGFMVLLLMFWNNVVRLTGNIHYFFCCYPNTFAEEGQNKYALLIQGEGGFVKLEFEQLMDLIPSLQRT